MLAPTHAPSEAGSTMPTPLRSGLSSGAWLGVLLLLLASSYSAWAGTIVVSGNITQSTADGTGPATNNAGLNSITDLQSYVLTLMYGGAIGGPGTYNLTGSTLVFSVPAAPATESDFGSISLTIAPDGTDYDFSMLACLNTGSGCAFGNQLDLNFKIPAASIYSSNVGAIGLDLPHPLDLLEDDGVTDIHGSVTTYTSVPEPSSFSLLLLVAALHPIRKVLRPSRKPK